ncbi:histidinol-phosphatase HisJ family protein [Clostridium paridis]|uniref:Histidinol-phosphatase n=1 Tax=Clostridium paridis TaxID=2803863 RepID=A0A937FIS8_9CLOT|nr:histidinol-phosphatase HisJ family protein [Clostridium paridis]MBL4932401.1 histidinol-phosphatase HisJ family protein [Clostridium paridis]
MIFDNHMHTIFSSDSKMKIEEVIEESKNKNLAVTLTEHIDLDFPDPALFRCDVPKYIKTYEPYRSEILKLGIEIGLNSSFVSDYTNIINSNPFDYVIGSVHMVNGKDIYVDFYNPEKSKDELYIEYLVAMEKLVDSFDCFDALGHIDYACRYAPYEDKEIHIELYGEYIDNVLKKLLSKDKLLELNTRMLHEKERYISLYKIFKRYKDLGGKYVTLGSDAHGKSAIGVNFKEANELITSIGLKAVHFSERKLEY